MKSLKLSLKRGMAGLLLGAGLAYGAFGCGNAPDKNYPNKDFICNTEERRCNDGKLEKCVSNSPLAQENTWEVIKNCDESCNPDELLCENNTELSHGGTVNEPFSFDLETKNDFNCEVKQKPNWSEFGSVEEGNTTHNIIIGTPWHISNEEVGKEKIRMDCESDTELQHHVVNLNINPGYYTTLIKSEGKEKKLLYDHIQPINLDGGTIEDVVLLCETNKPLSKWKGCPPIWRDNYKEVDGELKEQKNLEKKAKGIKKALNKVIEITGLNVLRPEETDYSYTGIKHPIEIHLASDTTCDGVGGGEAFGNIICSYYIIGVMFGDIDKCMDQDYPHYCNRNKKNLESIEMQEYIIHEYIHHILSPGHTSYEEFICHALQEAITYDKKLNEIRKYHHHNKLFRDMNALYGFELNDENNENDISEFLGLIRDDVNYSYISNSSVPDRLGDLKCKFDKITGENTYNTYVETMCNTFGSNYCQCYYPDGSKNSRCNSTGYKGYKNPGDSYHYIPPQYCGDYVSIGTANQVY